MTQPVVSIRDLTFAWEKGAPVLEIGALDVAAGERLFLRGPSGSGKSTLLGLIAGVIPSQVGEINVLGQNMAELSGTARDKLRADHLGVIFQMFNLVPYLTVLQNVTLALKFSTARRSAIEGSAMDEARRLLARLGLTDEAMLTRKATALSVGQQQRVAAARALIGRPSLIIADEPTSALDAETRDRFIQLLSEEAARSNAALLFVSHDAALAVQFDRALDLSDINRAAAARVPA